MSITISKPGLPSESLYNLIGGEKGLFSLVESFNNIIETQQVGKLLHILHLRGHGIAHSRIELFNFLSGFLGGPNLYLEKYGHANLRKMHEHVEVTTQAKEDWIACMAMALEEVGLEPNIKLRLLTHFSKVASNLVNSGHGQLTATVPVGRQ